MTGPPPKYYDFKTGVIGGSRSPLWYAWHADELVGWKSPVRERAPTERQYTKCDFLKEQVLDEGNCERVTDRGKEAREGVRKR